MASFTIQILDPVAPTPKGWLPERPANYNPDKFWVEDLGWTDVEVAGGGRYKNQIVIIGQTDLGNGCIYYGNS